jgi:hypothetical protein
MRAIHRKIRRIKAAGIRLMSPLLYVAVQAYQYLPLIAEMD